MVLDNMPDILTIKELAKYLKLSELTIKRAIYSGKLEAIKAGRDWRIEKGAVLKWIKIGNK